MSSQQSFGPKGAAKGFVIAAEVLASIVSVWCLTWPMWYVARLIHAASLAGGLSLVPGKTLAGPLLIGGWFFYLYLHLTFFLQRLRQDVGLAVEGRLITFRRKSKGCCICARSSTAVQICVYVFSGILLLNAMLQLIQNSSADVSSIKLAVLFNLEQGIVLPFTASRFAGSFYHEQKFFSHGYCAIILSVVAMLASIFAILGAVLVNRVVKKTANMQQTSDLPQAQVVMVQGQPQQQYYAPVQPVQQNVQYVATVPTQQVNGQVQVQTQTVTYQ